jgi:hypothetical protein
MFYSVVMVVLWFWNVMVVLWFRDVMMMVWLVVLDCWCNGNFDGHWFLVDDWEVHLFLVVDWTIDWNLYLADISFAHSKRWEINLHGLAQALASQRHKGPS